MIIGFAGNGHLMKYSFAAAYRKGFQCVSFAPGKTGDSAEDLEVCDIVYICPDRPSNTSPQQMVDAVLPHLNKDAILVIHCQVEPGFTRKVDWPKQQLCYQVETLRMKDADERATHPDRIIIGRERPVDGKLLKYLLSFNCFLIPISYEEAELAKIAINVYLAAQVCVTDTLANVAKEIGADWKNIIPALITDNRIGQHAYLQSGGYCGKHLERDLKQINEYSSVNTSVTEALLKYSGISENTMK